MTKLPVTLSIALLLVSCSSIGTTDFSILHSPSYEPEPAAPVEDVQKHDSYAAALELIEPNVIMVGEEFGYIESTPVEELLSEPSVEPTDEIPQPTLDEVVEAILEPSEGISEPVTFPSLPEPSTDITLPPPSDTVRIGSNELPMWFCYTSAGLFLASLFTLCYIAKQRKESAWHRFRD